ncbi:MAG: MFS transporter [Paludibacteraceae bacterium]|nr:MFS transporter [Paludibacteraceae bacterium]
MKNFIKTAVLIVCLILSVAMVIRWLDGERILPWNTEIALHHPKDVLRIGESTIIVDNGHRRLVFLNKHEKVDYILTNNAPASVSNGIWSLCADKQYLYALGTQAREGGIYAKAESILRYNIRTQQIQTLYERQFNDSVRVARGEIKVMWLEGDSLFFVRNEQSVCNLYSIAATGNMDEKPTPVLHRSILLDESLIRATHNEKGILLFGKFLHAWLWDEQGIHPVDYKTNQPSNDLPYEDGQRLPLAFELILSNILFMVSVLYILVMLCVAIAYLLRRINRRTNSDDNHHYGRNAVLIVGITLLIAGFYTYYLYGNYQQSYFKQICHLREQLDYLVPTQYMDVLEGIAEQGEAYIEDADHQQRISSLNELMGHMTQCPSILHDVYSDIFFVDDNGKGVNISDANETYLFWELMSNAEEISHILRDPHPGVPYKIWDNTGIYYSSLVPLEVSGRTFYIEVGCFLDDMRSASVHKLLLLFFRLLILFLVLYTLFTLARRLPKHYHSYQASRTAGASDAGVWLSGVVAFLFYAISAIDQGVMVYLVYSLNEGCTASELAIRASLPMLLYMSVGMTAYLIHPFLRQRFGDRWCNMGAGIVAACVFVMMGLSVLGGSFVFYCIGKGVSGLLMGIIFNSMYSLPLISSNTQLRNEGLASITLSCLGANILFISLGGFLSQNLGYSSVYFVNALLSVIVIFVAALVFPKRSSIAASEAEVVEDKPAEGRLRKALGFLLSGKMIAYYLGILLPFGMMNAYCYYLYPMYAESAGISVSVLSNLIVLGYALAFVFGENLVRWKNRRNGLWVLVSVFMVMAVLEITFSVSGNIYWATLVLFICCVLVAIPRSEANLFIAEQGKLRGLDVRDTNSGFSFALDATEAMASPLMGWCVGAGLVVGTNMIGAISLVLTSIFAVWQHHDEQKIKRAN